MTTTILRVAVLLATLAGTYLAGVGAVRAADPTLGATVESRVYVEEDRALRVWNRSDLEATFTFEPSGGWAVEPPVLVLQPDERSSVVVAGDGEDGATVAITVRSTAPIPPGHSESVISLASTVYHARPPDAPPWLWGAFWIVAAVIVAVLAAREARRILGGYSFRIERRP
jgi:hypothetical protein